LGRLIPAGRGPINPASRANPDRPVGLCRRRRIHESAGRSPWPKAGQRPCRR